METLKPLELAIMKALWKLKKAFMKEILFELPEEGAYNTILSTVRKLEKDNLVGHKAFGKTNQYFPLITEKKYKKAMLKQLLRQQFDNSPEKLFSFFIKEEKVDIATLEKLLHELKSDDK
jgi:predicted transcriptional regulator